MTISKLDFKVSEIVIALDIGCEEAEIISDMLLEGYPRPAIDKVIRRARLMLNEMLKDKEQEENEARIARMIQEALDECAG